MSRRLILTANQNHPYNENVFSDYMRSVRKIQQKNNSNFLSCSGSYGVLNRPSLLNKVPSSRNEEKTHIRNVTVSDLRAKAAVYNYNELEKLEPHHPKSTMTDEQSSLLSKFFKPVEITVKKKDGDPEPEQSAEKLENLKQMTSTVPPQMLRDCRQSVMKKLQEKFDSLLDPETTSPETIANYDLNRARNNSSRWIEFLDMDGEKFLESIERLRPDIDEDEEMADVLISGSRLDGSASRHPEVVDMEIHSQAFNPDSERMKELSDDIDVIDPESSNEDYFQKIQNMMETVFRQAVDEKDPKKKSSLIESYEKLNAKKDEIISNGTRQSNDHQNKEAEKTRVIAKFDQMCEVVMQRDRGGQLSNEERFDMLSDMVEDEKNDTIFYETVEENREFFRNRAREFFVAMSDSIVKAKFPNMDNFDYMFGDGSEDAFYRDLVQMVKDNEFDKKAQDQFETRGDDDNHGYRYFLCHLLNNKLKGYNESMGINKGSYYSIIRQVSEYFNSLREEEKYNDAPSVPMTESSATASSSESSASVSSSSSSGDDIAPMYKDAMNEEVPVDSYVAKVIAYSKRKGLSNNDVITWMKDLKKPNMSIKSESRINEIIEKVSKAIEPKPLTPSAPLPSATSSASLSSSTTPSAPLSSSSLSTLTPVTPAVSSLSSSSLSSLPPVTPAVSSLATSNPLFTPHKPITQKPESIVSSSDVPSESASVSSEPDTKPGTSPSKENPTNASTYFTKDGNWSKKHLGKKRGIDLFIEHYQSQSFDKETIANIAYKTVFEKLADEDSDIRLFKATSAKNDVLGSKKFGSGVSGKDVKSGNGVNSGLNPSYSKFGRYFVSSPRLEKGSFRAVTGKGHAVASLPMMKVDGALKKALQDIVNGGVFPESTKATLSDEDHAILSHVCHASGASTGLGMIRFHTPEDQKKKDRFELLTSMRNEGNDSPEVKSELSSLAVHLHKRHILKRGASMKIVNSLK